MINHPSCRVLILTNIVPPYRISLFSKLNSELNSRECHLKVVALAEREANRQWRIAMETSGFESEILPGWHGFIWHWELPVHLNWGVIRALRKYQADIIITSGYDSLAYWQAFFYAKLFRKPFILCNESTLLSTTYTRGVIGFLKRFIIRQADAYVAFGKKSREYLEAFGAKKDKIFTGIDTVDMEFFRHQMREFRRMSTFNSERGHFPKLLLLYVGQLIERKGIDQLLRALGRLDDPDVGLLVVGSGPQEKELREFCQSHALKNVYFEGFHQPNDLPRYYALADVFVLPSFKEVWGLVVNEALASGLYVLCSNRAGAAYDLIKEGWNGALFDPCNVEELAMLIQQTKTRIDELRARREAISKHACREFSIERSAKAFMDAIRAVTEERVCEF